MTQLLCVPTYTLKKINALVRQEIIRGENETDSTAMDKEDEKDKK